MNLSKFKSLNLAKSGKSLLGCAHTIDKFIESIKNNQENIKKPYQYLVATNVNTLMDFGRSQYELKEKNKYSYRLTFIDGLKAWLGNCEHFVN